MTLAVEIFSAVVAGLVIASWNRGIPAVDICGAVDSLNGWLITVDMVG